jgi:hypothetical protein
MKQRFSLPTYPTHSFLSLAAGQRESSSGLPRGLLAACVATALSASLLVGCGDPKLAEQAKFEKEFNTVASSYESAVRGNTALLSSNPSSESVAALRALAEQAKALSGGTAAQQEAATQLAASMYRTAGSIELARVSRIEAEQEIARSVAFNASLLAADLDAIGAAAEALDYSNATAVPEAMKSATTNATRTLQEEVRTLERPLGQLVAEISSRTAELARLESEAAVSMRRARESSAKIAEDYVNEAARIQEEARGVRNTLAEKTIEADDKAISLNLTQVELESVKAVQVAATEALDFVSGFRAEVDGAATKVRDLAAELKKKSDAIMKSIAEERAGALKSAYEAAAADFANAASSTGSSPASDALRTALMSEELRLKVTEVLGLGSHGRMVAATGGSDLAALKSQAETAITALKEKAAAAADAMAAISDEKLAELKASIDETKKMADGLSVDTLLAPPALAEKPKTAKKSSGAGSTGRSMSGDTGDAADRIDDIEAWVGQYNAAVESKPSSAVEMMLAVMDDSTSIGKAMKDMSAPMMSAMAPLYDAMQAKFGTTKLELGGGGMGGGGMAAGLGSGVSSLEKVSVDADRAVFKDANGQETVFVKTDAGWKVDLTSALEAQGMSAEQFEQMLPMVQGMMGPMMGLMKKAAADVAAKIESGEITSADDAGAAMQAAIQEAAASMMGGGGRRPRGGAANDG